MYKIKQFSFQRFLHPPHQSALLLYVYTYKDVNILETHFRLIFLLMQLRWVPINLKTFKKNSHEQAAFTLICLLGAANI